MIHEMIMVSKVPMTRQLIDLAILRAGDSEFLSFVKEVLSFLVFKTSWSVNIIYYPIDLVGITNIGHSAHSIR